MVKPPDRPSETEPSDPNRPSPRDSSAGEPDLSSWYRLSGIGLEFIVAVLVCGAGGGWLDRHMGTWPWLMVGGGLIGFAIGLWLLIQASRSMFR
jgi:F0F1-type ATP synthase assembly protein I